MPDNVPLRIQLSRAAGRLERYTLIYGIIPADDEVKATVREAADAIVRVLDHALHPFTLRVVNRYLTVRQDWIEHYMFNPRAGLKNDDRALHFLLLTAVKFKRGFKTIRSLFNALSGTDEIVWSTARLSATIAKVNLRDIYSNRQGFERLHHGLMLLWKLSPEINSESIAKLTKSPERTEMSNNDEIIPERTFSNFVLENGRLTGDGRECQMPPLAATMMQLLLSKKGGAVSTKEFRDAHVKYPSSIKSRYLSPRLRGGRFPFDVTAAAEKGTYRLIWHKQES